MEYSNFTTFCDKKICLRKSIYNSKTCIKEYKRERCYDKYEAKQEKEIATKLEVNEEEERFKEEVWVRDYGSYPKSKKVTNWKNVCRYWKSLTFLEQHEINMIHLANLYMNQDIDVAHIKGKGSHTEIRYEPSNAILMGRLFHSLIDTNINPITNSFMSKEDKYLIFQRILNADSN